MDVRKRSPGLNRNCPPSVRFPPLYEVGRNDPVFFQLEIDGRAFEAEQGFRAVRAADLAARPLKDIAQIALLKFRDRGKIRDDEGPRPDPEAVARLGDTSSSKGAFRMTARSMMFLSSLTLPGQE